MTQFYVTDIMERRLYVQNGWFALGLALYVWVKQIATYMRQPVDLWMWIEREQKEWGDKEEKY